jgi:hypothetical protein
MQYSFVPKLECRVAKSEILTALMGFEFSHADWLHHLLVAAYANEMASRTFICAFTFDVLFPLLVS